MPIIKKAKSDAEFVELMLPFLMKCRPNGSGKLIERLIAIARRGATIPQETSHD